jgi:hypothetical protein
MHENLVFQWSSGDITRAALLNTDAIIYTIDSLRNRRANDNTNVSAIFCTCKKTR